MLGRLAADPLARQSAFSAVATFVPQLVGLLTIPLLVSRLGDAAYGVWALVGTFIVVFMTLDGGISASAQRFYSLYAATGRGDLAARLTVTLMGAVTAFAALIWALGPWIAGGVLAVTDVPIRYHEDAITLFRHLGLLVGLLLLANVAMGQLRAQGRFGRVALAVALSQSAFVAALVWFGTSLTLANMLTVAIVQLGTLAGCLIAGMGGHLLTLRPRLTGRDQWGEFFGYANRSLVTNLSSLAFLQAGPLFVASFAPIEQVGQYSVAAMLASAIRSLPMFVITPLLNTLTEAFARGGRERMVRLGNRINALWTPGCLGLVLLAATGLWFVVRGFTGETSITPAVAILLTLGNGFNLSTGITTACCRAVGLPGLEARYSVVLTLGILITTAPAALLSGAIGVAVANLVVQVVALAYFARVLRRGLPGLSLGWGHVRWLTVVVSAAAVMVLCLPSLALPPRSMVTLLAAGAAVAAGAALYAVLNRRAFRDFRAEGPAVMP